MNDRSEISTPLLGEKKTFKEKVKQIIKEYWYLGLAFIIPALIMYLIYVAMGIHPIGEGSVLVLDLNGQYVSFFEALRHFIYGDASLLYSFARALGGEFMGMYAYYLASPFSYLVALFPQDLILEALLLIFLIKTGFCGFTFGFYLHKTNKDHRKFNKTAVISFSILYALSAYCVVQQHNTMWIDAVMWLPLVTYGIEELIKKGHFKVYVIFLALTVMSNFYIGWMVCIYSAVYFFVYYFMHNEKDRNNPYREEKHFARSFLRMGLFSLIAVAISAVIILTAYYSLSFGKNTFSNTNWALEMRFDILDMFAKFLPSSYDTVRPEGLPFVYCGVITLLLVPLFFCSNRFSVREKILSGVFIAFFILSFAISPVDIFWHGFQRPNWLNYRYSFMLCFFLLVIAYKALLELSRTSSKSLLSIGSFLILAIGIVQKMDLETYILDNSDQKNAIIKWSEGKLMTLECIWLTIICLISYLVILSAIKRSKAKRNISLIMVIVISLEVFANGLFCCLSLGKDVIYTSYTSYHDNIDPLKETVSAVKDSDSSFYRLETIAHKKANDNMALDVFGMTNSTSTLNATTIRFLSNMGYVGKSHESRYYAGNLLADSLLNVKYVLAGEENTSAEYKTDKALLSDSRFYSLYHSDKNYSVYENLYYLSLGYAVDADIKGLDLGKYHNPYDRLNNIVTKMLGETETVEVFKEITEYSYSTTNITESVQEPTETSNYKYAFTNFEKTDQEKSASVKYTFTLPSDVNESQYVYFYLPSEFQREFVFSAPKGSYGEVFGGEATRALFVGEIKPRASASVTLSLKENNLYVTEDVPLFYYLDYNTYVEVMERLDDSLLEIEEGFSDDRLKGSINTKNANSTIFTSIPYDAGWIVKVDGKQVNTYGILTDSTLEATKSADGALLAFDIEKEGDHTVELIYRPKAFTIGLTITVTAIIVFILIIIFEKPLNKICGKIFFPLTVPTTPPADKNGDNKEDDNKENDQNGKKTILVPPAEQGETPKGLEPSIPLKAMKFEKATLIEPIDGNESNKTKNGDID